ncbi:MAG: alkaline protease [Candidatus Hydrogenedentota bacterium]
MDALDAFLDGNAQALAETPGETVVLSARDCVSMAVAHNPKAASAQADREAAEARIGQANAMRKPQLKGSMTFTHTELNQPDFNQLVGGMGGLGGSFMQGGPFPGGGLAPWNRVAAFTQQLLTSQLSGGINFAPKDDFRTDKITLTQVFYAGGRISAAVKASKFLAESQAWQEQAALSQLEYEAKRAFYDVVAAASLVRVARNSVASYERNVRDTGLMLQEGAISPFEDLRSRTELGIRQSNLVEAENAHLLAQANLKRVVGLPQDSQVEPRLELDWSPAFPSVTELTQEALANRPEILALQKGVEAAEQEVRRAKGQFKPQVAGSVQYQNVDGGGYAQPDGLTFSVGAELDIYAGGRRKHEVLEKQAQLRSVQAELQSVEDASKLNVNQAVIQVRDAIARYKSDKANVTLATEGLRLAQLRYTEGVGTQAETLDAELALTAAENALVLSLRDYAVANAELDRATGRRWIKDGEAPESENSAEE